MQYPRTFIKQQSAEGGFTLIELSIVLVIIGLIVGGVLVGQDLIRAAEVRATITQIEKYNSAVNTFRGKFNATPGDMPASVRSQFGFTVVSGTQLGQGNGDGVLDGFNSGTGGTPDTTAHALAQGGGETGVFWVDLASSTAGNLIDGGFSTAIETTGPAAAAAGTGILSYLPAAKLGRGNYIYVFEGMGGSAANGTPNQPGINYFGMSAVSALTITAGVMTSTPTLTVAQAYNIDKKVDDGAPVTGNVLATYVTASAVTPSVAAGTTGTLSGGTSASGVAQATTTCYDNGNVATGTLVYSMGTAANSGAGANCGLSFKFQ